MLAIKSVLALLAATAAAQSIGSLPQCAQSCVGNSFGSTGCNPQDFKCICNSSGWIAGLSCCVSKACNMQEQQDIVNFAQQVCRIVQVNLPTMASCASSAASTPAPSGSMDSMSSSGGSAPASMTTSAPASGAAASSPSSGSSAAAASPTMAAGSKFGVAGGLIGGAAVGAAALLL